MVQQRPFSGNTRDPSADPDRSRVGTGLRESLVAVPGFQFRENRVYPKLEKITRSGYRYPALKQVPKHCVTLS
jgi:hypothetical protein